MTMQNYLPGLFSMLGQQGQAQAPWQQLQAAQQAQNASLLGLLGRKETSPGLYHAMGPGSLYYQPWMERGNWPAAGSAGGPAQPAAAASAAAPASAAGNSLLEQNPYLARNPLLAQYLQSRRPRSGLLAGWDATIPDYYRYPQSAWDQSRRPFTF
jgi:hypothetical protein